MKWGLLWLIAVIPAAIAVVTLAVTPTWDELEAFDNAIEAAEMDAFEDVDEDADVYA